MGGIKRVLGVRIAVLAILVFSFTTSANGITCRETIRRAVSGVILTTVILGAPLVGHEVGSRVMNIPHIGFSIYMDWDMVLTKAPSSLRELLENPNRDPETTVRALIEVLSQENAYSERDERFSLPDPHMASSYVFRTPTEKEEDTDRSITCKQMAVVVAGILNKAGIRAVPRWGHINADGRPAIHAWVSLPDLGLVADPTYGVVQNRDEYYRSNSVRELHMPMTISGKTIGLFSHE